MLVLGSSELYSLYSRGLLLFEMYCSGDSKRERKHKNLSLCTYVYVYIYIYIFQTVTNIFQEICNRPFAILINIFRKFGRIHRLTYFSETSKKCFRCFEKYVRETCPWRLETYFLRISQICPKIFAKQDSADFNNIFRCI